MVFINIQNQVTILSAQVEKLDVYRGQYDC